MNNEDDNQPVQTRSRKRKASLSIDISSLEEMNKIQKKYNESYNSIVTDLFKSMLFDIENDKSLLKKPNFINHLKQYKNINNSIDALILKIESDIKTIKDVQVYLKDQISYTQNTEPIPQTNNFGNCNILNPEEDTKSKVINYLKVYKTKEEDDEDDDDYDEEEHDDEDDDEDDDDDDDGEDQNETNLSHEEIPQNMIYLVYGDNKAPKEKDNEMNPKNKDEEKFVDLKKKKKIEKDLVFFRNLDSKKRKKILHSYEEILRLNESSKPYLFKALDLDISISSKAELINKLKQLSDSYGYGENTKLVNWVENVFRLPFNKYRKEVITKNNTKKEISKFLDNCGQVLENCIYGHKNAKNKILQVIAQNISNPKPEGIVLGIRGPMGNGKTTLIEKGVSKILNRPFAHISLGGAVDSSFLDGHSFTYEGSIWGKIADILMKSQCMNPVIYFDELDKVSGTHKGEEIINILIHLVDPSQNKFFQDKYFSGLDLDLSKCIFVFSYNDSSIINPILRDRITEIDTKGFKINEKYQITNKFLLPNIMDEVGFSKKSITIKESVLNYIIENYTFEGGVRKLKEKLYELVRELNLRKLKNIPVGKKIINFPFTVNLECVKEIFNNIPILTPEKIHSSCQIGKINGLYATSNDTGGLTPIESLEIPSDSKMQLYLTGNQGKIMKESVEVAKTLSWNILPHDNKKTMEKRWKNSIFTGLHVHCPEAATPKDGPSAGTAITVSIISRLLNVPIYNTVGVTGEIDLSGNVLEIGGLEHKLYGAKKAGVTKVLCPKQNKKDVDSIKREYPDLITDKFVVICIDNIWEALEHCLIDNNYFFENHCRKNPGNNNHHIVNKMLVTKI